MRRGKTRIRNSTKTYNRNEFYKNNDINEYELVLWRRPFTTLFYFTRELLVHMNTICSGLYNYYSFVLLLSLFIVSIVILSYISGPHQPMLQQFVEKTEWCLYWLGLGILSSIGLGTGLHTFLLYLGPHIASVTLAAYECGSLNFPEPPYPNKILCPSVVDPRWATNMLNIMQKVYLEAIMWGAGSAVGELPPYFIARAARLSDSNTSDSNDAQIEDDQKLPEISTTSNNLELAVKNIIEKVGFFGILACASIPNPLFDLAGIMCGHFSVPFWKFFGATLIGKAIIKMTIQKLFIIIALNETLFTKFLNIISYVPCLGNTFKSGLSKFLTRQKEKLHRPLENGNQESGVIEKIFQYTVIFMTGYFVISIVNSFAKNYYKRMSRQYKQAAVD